MLVICVTGLRSFLLTAQLGPRPRTLTSQGSTAALCPVVTSTTPHVASHEPFLTPPTHSPHLPQPKRDL